MATAKPTKTRVAPGDKVTGADLRGTERRWRRFGEPKPAGSAVREDGSLDYGLFGPGSVVWELVLHPSTIFFHHAAQQLSQDVYKPIKAGIRDGEPIVRKAVKGEFTIFDAFERLQRGAAMHLPMWLGDTETAERMAAHLHKIHSHVAGDVIDSAAPELGGYLASSPRESLWAGITELHPMLRAYESFAFQGLFGAPRRLPDDVRDQFAREMGAYLRLHGAPEDEIPSTMQELSALYAKYDDLFGHTSTLSIRPEDGQDYEVLLRESSKKNINGSHVKVLLIFGLTTGLLGKPVLGALPSKTRQGHGLDEKASRRALRARVTIRPLAWLLQRGPIERYFMRLLWGEDGVMLITSARELHKKVLDERRRRGEPRFG
ncbi:MAG: oxygenase MpaB family protein [Candidatus Microbacterium colombiense]|nr:MAG: oxygenase MpaB family protein [Microbacterium sp.]